MKIIIFVFCSLFVFFASSQDKIKVYFNQPVDNTVSVTEDAIYSSNIQDTLIAYIDRSTISLDVCNYNSSRSDIITAINNAYLRGVNVRYIGSKDVPFRNTKLNELNSNIGLIQRSGGFPGDDEMHNKFIIIDQNSTSLSTVITGSLNHTNSSIQEDYNNLVIIQDQALSSAYKIEFEEMWGSNTLIPNPTNSKFGAQKSDNTPHNFIIDGLNVELYFSPTDFVFDNISQAIQSADNSISVAMLTFKDNSLAQDIILKHNNGVNTSILLESDAGSSEYSTLANAGVPIRLNNQAGVLHHKYAIIDGNNSSSDPLVITGSQNWNDNTAGSYDENTLIIHDYRICQQFIEEFTKREESIVSIEEINEKPFILYPNPSNDLLFIKSELSDMEFAIYDICGNKIIFGEITMKIQSLDLSKEKSGIYFLKIKTSKAVYLEKIILY